MDVINERVKAGQDKPCMADGNKEPKLKPGLSDIIYEYCNKKTVMTGVKKAGIDFSKFTCDGLLSPILKRK